MCRRSGEDAELHKQSAGEDASVELPSDSNNVLDQLKELEQVRIGFSCSDRMTRLWLMWSSPKS